jgi:tripeptide aminopeptidase
MKTVLDRFLNYVSYNTQSNEDSATCPSTPGQLTLGAALVEEMKAMGITDAAMDQNGYIMGTVPGDPGLPTIGLIAHMDTSPDSSGADIKAKVVPYTGEDLCLNPEKDIWLRASEYPSLNAHVGKHLVVTDGTTLLGADDKAGIAEIMTAAQLLLQSKEKHATVRIGFTPDEEIGRGADLFNVQAFGADFAYTVDGGTLGELEYENFNGAGALITIHGRNIHPGSAKNKLVNSQLIAMELNSLLPVHQRPESTEGYEGFFHLIGISGTVEETTLRYIIRDHSMEKFEQKKQLLTQAAEYLNRKFGEGTVTAEISDSYYNMRCKIEPCMHIVERAKKAMEAVGVTPRTVPIRGGTDGARLSFEGLPCPNLFTGGENFHGRFEYVPVEDMESAVALLLKLVAIS